MRKVKNKLKIAIDFEKKRFNKKEFETFNELDRMLNIMWKKKDSIKKYMKMKDQSLFPNLFPDNV